MPHLRRTIVPLQLQCLRASHHHGIPFCFFPSLRKTVLRLGECTVPQGDDAPGNFDFLTLGPARINVAPGVRLGYAFSFNVIPPCGRFTRTSPRPILAEEFGGTHFVNVDLSPRHALAHGKHAPLHHANRAQH